MKVSLFFTLVFFTQVSFASLTADFSKKRPDPRETMSCTERMEKNAIKSVHEVMTFFEGWWTGSLHKNSHNFLLSAILDPNFSFVTPDGFELNQVDTLNAVFAQHGTKRETLVAIEDRDFEILASSCESVTLRYLEEHFYRDGTSTQLYTTSVLRRVIDWGVPKMVWVRVQETLKSENR